MLSLVFFLAQEKEYILTTINMKNYQVNKSYFWKKQKQTTKSNSWGWSGLRCVLPRPHLQEAPPWAPHGYALAQQVLPPCCPWLLASPQLQGLSSTCDTHSVTCCWQHPTTSKRKTCQHQVKCCLKLEVPPPDSRRGLGSGELVFDVPGRGKVKHLKIQFNKL